MTQDLSDLKLEEWERIAREATPGPWELQDGCSWRRIGTRWHDGNVLCPTNHPTDHHPDLCAGRGEDVYANLRHITTFDPPTVLSLLSALKEAREALRPIAKIADHLTPGTYGPAWGFNGGVIEHEDLLKARKAFTTLGGSDEQAE
jgi:hypothetical protein